MRHYLKTLRPVHQVCVERDLNHKAFPTPVLWLFMSLKFLYQFKSIGPDGANSRFCFKIEQKARLNLLVRGYKFIIQQFSSADAAFNFVMIRILIKADRIAYRLHFHKCRASLQ